MTQRSPRDQMKTKRRLWPVPTTSVPSNGDVGETTGPSCSLTARLSEAGTSSWRAVDTTPIGNRQDGMMSAASRTRVAMNTAEMSNSTLNKSPLIARRSQRECCALHLFRCNACEVNLQVTSSELD